MPATTVRPGYADMLLESAKRKSVVNDVEAECTAIKPGRTEESQPFHNEKTPPATRYQSGGSEHCQELVRMKLAQDGGQNREHNDRVVVHTERQYSSEKYTKVQKSSNKKSLSTNQFNFKENGRQVAGFRVEEGAQYFTVGDPNMQPTISSNHTSNNGYKSGESGQDNCYRLVNDTRSDHWLAQKSNNKINQLSEPTENIGVHKEDLFLRKSPLSPMPPNHEFREIGHATYERDINNDGHPDASFNRNRVEQRPAYHREEDTTYSQNVKPAKIKENLKKMPSDTAKFGPNNSAINDEYYDHPARSNNSNTYQDRKADRPVYSTGVHPGFITPKRNDLISMTPPTHQVNPEQSQQIFTIMYVESLKDLHRTEMDSMAGRHRREIDGINKMCEAAVRDAERRVDGAVGDAIEKYRNMMCNDFGRREVEYMETISNLKKLNQVLREDLNESEKRRVEEEQDRNNYKKDVEARVEKMKATFYNEMNR